MRSAIAVERAGPGDLDEVVAILSEAARWLLSRGIDQWPDPFPASRVEGSLARGDTYLVRLGGRVVATLSLEWSDELFWGERPPDAAYVHRVAVRREAAGLGRDLIEWAENRARAAGRQFLRLDCMAENSALRAYYERLGFEPRGEAAIGRFRAALYERPVRK